MLCAVILPDIVHRSLPVPNRPPQVPATPKIHGRLPAAAWLGGGLGQFVNEMRTLLIFYSARVHGAVLTQFQ